MSTTEGAGRALGRYRDRARRVRRVVRCIYEHARCERLPHVRRATQVVGRRGAPSKAAGHDQKVCMTCQKTTLGNTSWSVKCR